MSQLQISRNSGGCKVNGDFCAEYFRGCLMRDRYYLNLYRHASQRAREHDRELKKFKIKFKRIHYGRRSKTVSVRLCHLTRSVINFSEALRQNYECARAMFKRSTKRKGCTIAAHSFALTPVAF